MYCGPLSLSFDAEIASLSKMAKMKRILPPAAIYQWILSCYIALVSLIIFVCCYQFPWFDFQALIAENGT
jgi:hypothetical protein